MIAFPCTDSGSGACGVVHSHWSWSKDWLNTKSSSTQQALSNRCWAISVCPLKCLGPFNLGLFIGWSKIMEQQSKDWLAFRTLFHLNSQICSHSSDQTNSNRWETVNVISFNFAIIVLICIYSCKLLLSPTLQFSLEGQVYEELFIIKSWTYSVLSAHSLQWNICFYFAVVQCHLFEGKSTTRSCFWLIIKSWPAYSPMDYLSVSKAKFRRLEGFFQCLSAHSLQWNICIYISEIQCTVQICKELFYQVLNSVLSAFSPMEDLFLRWCSYLPFLGGQIYNKGLF